MTPRHEPRILVVDDDADICQNLSDILTDLGYMVDYAHDGRTALELVHERPYDIALLDLKMPGMDGLSLYREIKKHRAGTVSLLITAYANAVTAAEAISAGAWKVLSKPVDFPGLLGLVEQALRQPLVLVVDDDRDLCGNLWDVLRDRGFRVSMAHDCSNAALELKQSSFEVVLIDMRIPDRDGGAVFEMVRSANPDARTILITGHRSELDEAIARIIADGANAVCYKPFDVPKLVETIERLAAVREGQGAGA
jgi:DNA-binding NtrC family response regulator